MDKQKNIYGVCFILLALTFIVNIILFATKIFRLWLFLILTGVITVLFGICLYFYNKRKNKKPIKEKVEQKSTGNYLTDLYEVLGIPVQYNKDGSVKSIYELLGIEPIYDDAGNRVKTIYELLKMMPKFNANGEEVPLVFSIKNRVGKIAKVDLSNRVLTRKLSEEEKEELAIREALNKKMKEAEQQGDKNKAKAIQQVIVNNKKSAQAKKGSKEKLPVYKITVSGGTFTQGVYTPSSSTKTDDKAINKMLDNLFSRVGKKSQKPPVAVKKENVNNKSSNKYYEMKPKNNNSKEEQDEDSSVNAVKIQTNEMNAKFNLTKIRISKFSFNEEDLQR